MTALNEISTKVLSSFIKKRKEQLNAKPGKGRPSKEAVAKKQKMQSGVKKAEEKTTAIINAKYEQHKKNNNEVIDHVKKEIPGALKEHGYSHSVGNEKHDIYSKSHPEGVITHMVVHKSGPKAGHTLMTGKSTTGWQGSEDTLNHHDFEGFDSYKKSVDQRKAEVPAMLKNHIEKYESYHKAKALDESVQPTDHSDKLFAIVENAEYDQYEKNNNEVIDHVKKEIPGALKAHGYSFATGNKKRDIYSKSHPEGVITHMVVHKSGPKAGHTIMSGESTSGWHGYGDTLNHNDFDGIDSYKKSVDQRKAEVPAMIKNRIEKYESYHKAKALEESVMPTDHSDKLFAIVENSIAEKPLEVSSYVDFMLKAKAIKEIEKMREEVSNKIFVSDPEDEDEEDVTNPDE